MSTTQVGEGIVPVEMPTFESPDTPVEMPSIEAIAGENLNAFRALIHQEMAAYVADAERRLAQAREIEDAIFSGVPRQSVHAEDLNIGRAMVDGYNLTANSPSAGYIAWANLHVVLAGVDYTITDGNTNKKFAWFVKPGSGTSATLSTSDTMPVLGSQDALIFVNNSGSPVSVLESTISYAVGAGVIGDAQIAGGIAQSKISGLSTSLQAGLDAAAAAQATADGAISQTFGAAFPWTNGTVKPAANTGDVHTFQGNADQVNWPDGTSYRWNGPSGTPTPNQWILITDTALSKALADSASALSKVSTKVTVYYRTVAAGAPAAPSGGFTTGDQWVQTDNGNYTQYWNGSAWTPQLYGDAAIAGVSGTKVGSGISPANLTGAGTVPLGGIPQIGPTKLNTAFHILY